MCEYLRVSALTGKRVKRNNDFVIKEHHLFCNHSFGFDNFSILASNNNDLKVTLMESLLINRDHPPLNGNRNLLRWELFDDWGTYFYYVIAVDWSDCIPLISHRYCFIKWMVFYKQKVQAIRRNQVYFISSNASTGTTVIVKD